MSDIIGGHCDPRFHKLHAALADEITGGEELGASIAIDIGGTMVVDIWGGHTDAARTRGWEQDTVVNLWSSTKPVTSLAALVLADRGLLDVFAPVATYWPEFAANGKQDIEVRHILSFTSGVSGWEAPFSIDDVYDWPKATSQLAAQAPWWPPGSASGYHLLNYGHLVGEIVRRITGKTLKEFVREEIAAPLDADIQIGARAEDENRIAEVIPPPPLQIPLEMLPKDSPMFKTFSAPQMVGAEIAHTTAWRRADIGAANGHGNARSLARALSPISLGGKVNEVRLLDPATIDVIFGEQSNGIDHVLAVPLRMGVGFGLPEPTTFPAIPEGRICFWGGWGGSAVIMNPDRGATFAYVMNKMGPGTTGTKRTQRYMRLFYEALA
ncbi:MAG: beta-lactamase family protein [Mycobacteriaceae bacterium]|nr:beta-lactamase family protein [Mycobacteriaceae bacterium]